MNNAFNYLVIVLCVLLVIGIIVGNYLYLTASCETRAKYFPYASVQNRCNK